MTLPQGEGFAAVTNRAVPNGVTNIDQIRHVFWGGKLPPAAMLRRVAFLPLSKKVTKEVSQRRDPPT